MAMPISSYSQVEVLPQPQAPPRAPIYTSGSRVLQGQDGLGRVWESEFQAEDPYLRIQGELYTHFEES